VVSYKIRPEVARRLRRYAHNQDQPIGHIAEQALLEFLERVGG
jgi:predicted transcriptional regulator